jgi:hypothetical protein
MVGAAGPPPAPGDRDPPCLEDLPGRIAECVERQRSLDEQDAFDDGMPTRFAGDAHRLSAATDDDPAASYRDSATTDGGGGLLAPRWRWPFPLGVDGDAFPPPSATHLHFPVASSGGPASAAARDRRREAALKLYEGAMHMRPVRSLAPASREEAVRSPSPVSKV